MEVVLHKVFLGLGSNLGDRKENINKALSLLESRIGKILSVSSIYRTEPVGFESDNYFINAACVLQTELQALDVLEYTQAIEKQLGRKEKSVKGKYHDRIIDIDVLLYDDIIVDYPHFTLPHPHLHERKFVLEPLAEIAPEIVHPILGKTISELNQEQIEPV